MTSVLVSEFYPNSTYDQAAQDLLRVVAWQIENSPDPAAAPIAAAIREIARDMAYLARFQRAVFADVTYFETNAEPDSGYDDGARAAYTDAARCLNVSLLAEENR